MIIVVTKSEVNIMPQQKKMGRPFSENPKDKILRIRVDTQTIDRLDECAKTMNTNRSEIIRKGIKKIYDDLNKK
jgi:Leu/Phe-tRNA-protein transferase